jgi:hypothetical protein
LRARWRSDDFSPGRYEFRATGFDMAGNSASGSNRANGAPMTLPNPLKAGVRLAAGFGSRGSPARSVPYGAGVVFAGRLQASSDASLGGQPVRIVERFAAGAELPARTTVVVTDADGGFATRLAPGPSREVTAVFAGTRNVARAAAGPFRLGVRSRVSLRASASRARIGGKPILFIGRVAGRRGELPPGGVSVQLQFRAAGLPWSEFRTVRTGPAGRFRYRYRFSDDDSRGVRFLFRAVGEAQGDWPYEPGSSRPVAVRGV